MRRPDVPPDAPEWEQLDFETLFVVSWRAERPGVQVPCEVHTLERAALRVRVIEPSGDVVPGATVYGCGSGGDSDAAGIAVLEEAYAGDACTLMASASGRDESCEGSLEITAVIGADSPGAVLEAPSDERILAVYRELGTRGLGDGADVLLDGLIAHRKRVIALSREMEQAQMRRDELMKRMDALAEQIEATSDPAEKHRLWDEMIALTQEMIDED